MPNKRSLGKLELKLARNYVYTHKITRHANNDPDEVREVIYTGTPEELQSEVLSKLQGERSGYIPEYPQGLILYDSRGHGFFDKQDYITELNSEVKQ